MSLSSQRIQIEAKINAVKREKVSTDLEADMYLASLLSFLDTTIDEAGDLDADKIEHTALGLARNIRKYNDLRSEEKRLTNLL